MANNNLTIFQKLTKVFGFQNGEESLPTYKFTKDELLKTDSKEDYQKALLQAQQSQYLADKWTKIDQSLYNQSVYYEPNRLSAYYDYESMEFSLHGDTQIVTPNGSISIKELSDKGRDYEFITYAYDHNSKKVVPALARNAHYTRDDMTYKITFDDGSFIIASIEHRFLKRDGVFCKVKNLKVGDSMMPFYRKSFYNNKKYNWVYTCNSNEGHHGWISEHNIIAEWFYKSKIDNSINEVHHIDFNGKNNLPENLKIMSINEHRSYHATLNNEKLWKNPDYVEKMKIVAKSSKNFSWDGRRSGKNNPAYVNVSWDNIVEYSKTFKTIKETSENLNISIPKLTREIKSKGYKSWRHFTQPETSNIKEINVGINNPRYKHIPWDLLVETALIYRTQSLTSKILNVSHHKIIKDIKRNGFNNWKTFINAYDTTKKTEKDDNLVNHKITSIEPYGIVPVYDLTVPGYKNFATDTIFSHNTPEISASLDIYAEESCTMSEKGEILTIYSESKRIKSILEDLFKNTLDINTNLQMWARGMCKYGDDFVYLKVDPEKGVVGCQQLPNIEIERIEGSANDGMNTQLNTSKLTSTKELRFAWKNKDIVFQSWEMAHFRILGDDRKLPYGTSMLDKIRRIWKQLLLAEDAMLIYRTSRAPERRVFKVFVGNMDDKDVEPYVQRVANKFKRDQIVDQRNGQVDMRYNQMAVDQDFFIPVRDLAQTSPIETLPGAQNLGEIADIEYIQKKLLAALRIPKAFLGFEEVVGDGKNLALMDIRFARTINRIQKSLIQELNKIAIVHLYILGLDDELNNFSLSLTNPSAQSDLLRIEQWKEKITLYKDATSDQSNMGILPTSHTWAKKNILGMSDNEIILDLQQQRLERAIGFELTNTQVIIKRSGVFDEVDKKYGIPEEERQKIEMSQTAQPAAEGGMDLGGMGGLPGGEVPDMGMGAEPMAAGADMSGAPLSESTLLFSDKKVNINELFDFNKAQKNIYQIENKLKEILNEEK